MRGVSSRVAEAGQTGDSGSPALCSDQAADHDRDQWAEDLGRELTVSRGFSSSLSQQRACVLCDYIPSIPVSDPPLSVTLHQSVSDETLEVNPALGSLRTFSGYLGTRGVSGSKYQ